MRKSGLVLIIITLLLYLNTSVVAQSLKSAPDSLLGCLENTTDPDKRIELLDHLCHHYVHTDLARAAAYSLEAERLLQRTTPPNLRGDTWYSRTITTMTIDSGIYYIDKAIDEYKVAGDSSNLGEAYNLKAEILADYGRYTEALPLYQEALGILERRGSTVRAAYIISNIALVYNDMYNPERSAEYSLIALKKFRDAGDTNGIASTLIGMTEYYFSINDTAGVFSTIEEEISLYHHLGKRFMEAYVISSLADAYMEYRNDYDGALRLLYRSLEMCDTTSPNRVIYVNTLRKVAQAYLAKKEAKRALRYALKAVAATDTANKVTVMYNELLLIYVYIELGDSKKAAASLNKYRDLSDSMHSQQIEESIAGMQVRYETLRKENQILLLEEDKQRGRLLLGGLAALFIAALIVTVLLVHTLRYRRKLAEQELDLRERRIHELEQQRRLEASESVIEGAEKERKRIARDLHDGLGGLLTGLRFNLGAVRGNYISTGLAAEEFDKAVGLLDESIGELRRVARNMMPETLLRLGLRDALDDFCNVIGRDKHYRVTFSSYGEVFRVPARFETGIYRVAQELINNAVRHSGAELIAVQLIYDTGRMHLTVSDDGKGFDTTAPVTGTGLVGLRSRCESLGGTLSIESSPGAGTEVSAGFITKTTDTNNGQGYVH